MSLPNNRSPLMKKRIGQPDVVSKIAPTRTTSKPVIDVVASAIEEVKAAIIEAVTRAGKIIRPGVVVAMTTQQVEDRGKGKNKARVKDKNRVKNRAKGKNKAKDKNKARASLIETRVIVAATRAIVEAIKVATKIATRTVAGTTTPRVVSRTISNSNLKIPETNRTTSNGKLESKTIVVRMLRQTSRDKISQISHLDQEKMGHPRTSSHHSTVIKTRVIRTMVNR